MSSVRTGPAESDIGLQVADTTKTFANFVEWNVDMKVTVSRAKRSKIIQRLRNLVIVIMTILFAVALSHLKKEVRALQVQMHNMNVNLQVLMSRYDRLNRNFNRAWFLYEGKPYKGEIMPSAKHLGIDTGKPLFPDSATVSAKMPEILGISDGPLSMMTPVLNAVVRFSEPASSPPNRMLIGEGREKVPADEGPRENSSSTIGDNNVIDRSKRGSVLKPARKILTLDHISESDESVGDDDLDSWREPRSGRMRRDEGRGPMVATFVGAIPEQHVTDAVHIGPWVKSTRNDSQYSLNKFHLVEDKKSIEVTSNGLYMISVQIFYFGEPKNYSYWLLLSSEGASATQKLVKCATASAVSAAEVSCYTSVIAVLRRGDRLHVQQQERDRLINMREGHSYIQLVLLSGNVHKRRSN